MELQLEDKRGPFEHVPPRDWARLLRKLRWIGLEDDAKRLEAALSTLPPDERCGASFGPFSTD